MDTRVCLKCKKLYQHIVGDQICPTCRKILDDDFGKVKEYVYEHKNATINEVAEECDVSARQIKNWLKEGRLELSEASGEVTCGLCGVALKSGMYCADCRNKMNRNLQSMLPKKNTQEVKVSQTDHKSAMRFF